MYINQLVLIPIVGLVLYTSQLGLKEFYEIVTNEQVWSAFIFSFQSSLLAAFCNLIFGFVLAWSLARYDFFGKKVIDGLIDLPFALPTAVAGIALASIFASDGVIGKYLPFEVAYTQAGVVVALIFIGLPFVVRTLEPMIRELDEQNLEAARTLGASFFQIFFKVILPSLIPALLTGFSLAFARGLGEYGSVIFISSNMPFVSEILPLVIVNKLLQFDYLGASAVGVFMLLVSFAMLYLINILHTKARV